MIVDTLEPAAFRVARQELLAAPWSQPADRRAALSDLTDDWLGSLFAAAGAPTRGVALVAVGGYGRRELSPGSDVDLVLLHSPGVEVTALADQIWYPVWDSGLRLDHSVRTPAQARRMANSDLKVMLGLLDARTVAGDEALLAGLRTSALADWRARAASRLGDLRDMVRIRRATFGDLAYLQEPDLKDSIGGLRDVVIMRAIAASWVADVPRSQLAAPYTLLLDVRDALHTVTGRSSDKLIRQEQATIAGMLDLPDPNGDGDGLLRAVASAGRTIDWASDMVWHRVDRLRRPSRLPGLKRLGRDRTPQRIPLAEGAVIDDGEVVLARDARPDRDAGLTLRLASATARAGLRIAPATVRRLAESAGPLPVPWTDAMRNDFVGLIGAGRGMVPVWEALDQEGLIVRLLPEWEPTRSAPQHNPVHLHTVDRHLLETAVRAASYSREVARPDLLLTAAMVHDIGKPAGRASHSEVGAQIAADMLPRLGYGAADTAVIVDLVRHHLVLADTATRRDISDPDTVMAVADAVGGPEQLELLWALTRADAEATGPAAWSPWKEALIDSLVEQVAAVFAGRPDVTLPGPTEAEEVAAAANDVVVLRDERGGLEELVIGTPKAELADIAAVLALHRLQVIEARASLTDQRSVSTWRVAPSFGEAPDAHRIAVDLRRMLAGTLSVHDRLMKRETSYLGGQDAPAPRVVLLPEASRSATVVEVRAADSSALLYRLLHSIATRHGHVRAAKVSTLGADVVDVFYVVGDDGRPLSSEVALGLRDDLLVAAAVPGVDG
ncbi:MAG: Bifunctional uridylyltransferase/uridylyl-removing enzyme [Actinomycetota bacterium]|nr:Bifunctional uridylyltransferase/uridylyl-removing enzyme [Actinomycetota bacterium]